MSPSTSGRRPAPTRRPRNSLTAEAILDAAERVAAGGLDGLTVRAVAAELEAAPMSLYRYFATKEALVDALLDRVLGRFDPGPATDDWRADLASFARAHAQLLADHPWAVAVLFSRPAPGLNAVGVGEQALAILQRGGIEGADAVATFSALLAFSYGWQAFATAQDPSAPPTSQAPDIAPLLAALPVERFPLTVAVAEPMAAYAGPENFERALALVLGGVVAAAPPGRAPRGRR
jgi:AcrR family transcriptional regulator